jgi:hypothetical protein
MAERDLLALRAALVEMRHAEKKHGDLYMGNLADVEPRLYPALLRQVRNAGEAARLLCDSKTIRGMRKVPKIAVLMEEVGEAADAILRGENPTEELLQVAAMALAWLDVDYDLALRRLRRTP